MSKEKKQESKHDKKHSGLPIEKRSKEEQIEAYKQQIEALQKQNKELTETLQRLQAESDNIKKRTEKEKESFCKFANKELIIKLLPLLDNFELALKNTENHGEFVKGVELIFSQFFEILEQNNITKIESLGKTFDPYMHEALMQGKDDNKKNNEIIEEFQKGYMLNNQVIRHSKVKVNKI